MFNLFLANCHYMRYIMFVNKSKTEGVFQMKKVSGKKKSAKIQCWLMAIFTHMSRLKAFYMKTIDKRNSALCFATTHCFIATESLSIELF